MSRIGVAPEKSIKLVVNGFVRSCPSWSVPTDIQVRAKLTDPETGRISLSSEIIAGGSAGAAQVSSKSIDMLSVLSSCPIYQPSGGEEFPIVRDDY
jgi:hypothetical protein